MSGTLSGSSVLITGAVGGIGTAAARAFASEGARLALVDMDDQGLAVLTDELCAAGASRDGVITFTADVSEEAHVSRYVRETADRFGAIDVLFNNAGVAGSIASAHSYDVDDFDRIMAVNVRGVWLNMKHAAGVMLAAGRGGSIINAGSAVSLVGAADLAPYTASKHAVLGLTRSVALELATSGIRVNAVCPGPTDTGMQRSIELGLGGAKEGFEAVNLLIPMRRHARPEEIAAAVLFLASPAASFITGAAIPVDGAFTAD